MAKLAKAARAAGVKTITAIIEGTPAAGIVRAAHARRPISSSWGLAAALGSHVCCRPVLTLRGT
jgi:hypothetical protein